MTLTYIKMITIESTVGCKKKTETVRIKLTHFYNFFIVSNLLTRDRLELWSKFKDIFKNYLIGTRIVK
jgi:hypothetical protein